MIITDFDCLRIQYSAELSLIRYQWQKAGSLTGFRAALNHVLALVQQHQVQYCLLDLHDLPDIGIEEQVWLGTQWLPRIVRHQARQVALVVPVSRQYNQMVVESLLKLGRAFIRFEVQYFSDPLAALDWLTCSEEEMTRLQLEWQAAGGI
ncbi:hypothetical protein SAMN02745146_0593 [Hymenobacter daecheongensis DSM 21074]|uniref:SpoIIAA-like n=1 Tax=Hymenobacter daecheongensis DSM 21074 TaxID=1121955 RepID=A0A1M6ACZ6_9BACT|nr:STAS/SEC14 domain-containing protein [Hymenobacter daecheongensis]SHI34299.1 hypothetical protein SAMN02745146_0593 [Hymenobacter daecheongensis DSM 21074]